MKRRKQQEGAVLLLLIIIMSTVVLVVASLLRFNIQNARFAQIEMAHEQALYLAEGVADTMDYQLILQLQSIENYNRVNVGKTMESIAADLSTEAEGNLYSFDAFPIPGNSPYIHISGETYPDVEITAITANFYPGDTPWVVEIQIDVSAEDTNRSIRVEYEFPEYQPDDSFTTFIRSKSLNYSNF